MTELLQTETHSTFRLCKQFHETVEYIISACPILAQAQYREKHDRVCVKLQFNIYKEIGVKLDNEHWYDHVPKSVK